MAVASAASIAMVAFLTLRNDYQTTHDTDYFSPDVDGRQTGGASGGSVSPRPEEGFELDLPEPGKPKAAPELMKENLDSLKSLGYTSGEREQSVESGLSSGEDKLERVDEFRAR
jgi:hypothetical protein